MKRFALRTGLLGAFVLFAAPVWAAQCVTVTFLDAKGNVIPVNRPVIGIMLGGKLAIEDTVPAHASQVPGAETACPPALVETVRKLFESSCLSDSQRRQTAVDNAVDLEIINDGCSTMGKVLNKDQK